MTQPASEAPKREILDLTARKGLIVSIANQHNLAWLAAEHFRNAGAELAITYLMTRPFVEPLAHELGPKGVRVNAISAGAVKTRAASRIEHFDDLLNETMRKVPLRRTVDACEVGHAALLLASDYTTAITGEVLYVDAGFHIEGMVFH